MLSLLLGPDDFTKREYLKITSLESGLILDLIIDTDNTPEPEDLAIQDLFSKPKMYVLQGVIQKFRDEKILESLVASKNHIVLMEGKLDKRVAENKALLANKSIAIKEFSLPHGPELNQWIQTRFSVLGGIVSKAGVEELAVRLGRDNAKEIKVGGRVVAVEEVYNLYQADSEIRKLVAYASGKEVGALEVGLLVAENIETDVFSLTNAIADKQKQKAMELLNKFLKGQSGAEEKGAIIQLNALLSEQFRNVAIVQDFITRKTSETDILEKTGWKSGRLFVIKKIADRFEPKKVLETLNKFNALDEELKTSQVPPRTLLDLILSQLF